MFTTCESGRELVLDAGTVRQQTENKAVKPHAVYGEFGGKKSSEETVSKGNDGVDGEFEEHISFCLRAPFEFVFVCY